MKGPTQIFLGELLRDGRAQFLRPISQSRVQVRLNRSSPKAAFAGRLMPLRIMLESPEVNLHTKHHPTLPVLLSR
ncbi:hypothetical protein KO492_10110 [Celeribacter halophilus]|nr:hypothetical protein [Celeribacter halophilus]